MSGVRVIALGNPMRGDDGAALTCAQQLRGAGGVDEVLEAGRPGPELVDLLSPDAPTLLLDVVQSGAAPGAVVSLPLVDLPGHAACSSPVSTHGFGPAEALRLARQLGRSLPRGRFLGIEGDSFELGTELSPAVSAAMEDFVAAARDAVAELCGDRSG